MASIILHSLQIKLFCYNIFMKHEEVYKLSDLFARYLLGKNGNEDLLTDLVNSTLREFNFEEVKDLEIIDPSPKAGFSLNLSDNIELKENQL